MRQVIARPATRSGAPPRPAPVLLAGIIAFAAALAGYLAYVAIHPLWWMFNLVDLHVYLAGGLIVRHVLPVYNPHLATPLYSWQGPDSLLFTYTPFAAVAFAVVSFIPWSALQPLSVAVNIVLLLAALWVTFRALGYRDTRVRLGATLLAGAAVLWTEPVLRTLYFGQINIALMALILWDLTQPDTKRSRWWKGTGTGIAAGIKLVPLIFIPYLLLARKFRQAAVATGAFAGTIAAGFVFLPADSRLWWLHGLIFDSNRTGFIPWGGGQSLRALLARTMGSVAAAQPAWLVAAVLVGAVGIACAAVLDLAGHQVPGILTCALTGLLVSPVTWDHHWVWIAPDVAAAAYYAIDAMRAGTPGPGGEGSPLARDRVLRAGGRDCRRLQRLARQPLWPARGGESLRVRADLGSAEQPYPVFVIHNEPWWKGYHWTGLHSLAGNSSVLGGLMLLGILVLLAVVSGAIRPLGSLGGWT